MKQDANGDNRQIGRPNTIRNLISGMNSNANSSLTVPFQQSVSQQSSDESMAHKVNLAAAFHDHISCTKAGGNINSLIAFQVSTESNAKKQSSDAIVFGSSDEEEDDDDKEQIARLKSMILVQLDLIQYQQEQLLKKDRQLQGLKQDREALCLRLEKMERRITYLTSKLANVSENSGEDTETIVDSKDSETNDSVDPFNLLNDSSTLFSRLYSTANSNACLLNVNNQLNTSVNSQTSHVNVEASSSTSKPSFNSFDTKDDRCAKKRSLVTTDSLSSVKKKNRFSKPLDNENKSCLAVKSVSSYQNNEKNKCNKKRKPNGKLKKCDSVVNESIDFNINVNIIETDSPYDIVVNKEDTIEDEDSAGDLKTETTLIEVPSWRLHPITTCYSLEGTENLDDEAFNRRHSKLEIDERRRKRWDIQRMREQKNNERLRSGRYYNNYVDKPSDTKNGVEIYTFFPEPKEVQYIEVSDTLPVVAFGHPIPRLPERYFSLPWLTSHQKQRKAVNS